MTFSIHYVVTGLDEMIDAMDQLTKPPTPHTIAALDAVLEEGYEMTQGQVHVISEELKLSGDTDSKLNGYSWTGSINYGGPSGSSAYYAIYELNRGGTRPDGTPHDFFTGLEVLDGKFEDAINSYFEPLKG